MSSSLDIRRYYTPIQPNAGLSSNTLLYREQVPDPRLQKFIYCYWQFKTLQALAEELRHTIVADGCIDIFFEQENPSDSFVMGFCETSTEFSLTKSFSYVGIRFLPTMFSQIFQINAKELSNRFLHLADLLPKTALFIKNNLEPQHTLSHISSALDRHFLQQINLASFDWDHRVYESLEIILRNRGVVDVQKDLNTGLSQRQLRRLFEFYIGDTPKTFSQVVRFQNVLKAKPSRHSLKEEKLFFDLGYYDQSHFIKEFKKLHGLTPNKAFGD